MSSLRFGCVAALVVTSISMGACSSTSPSGDVPPGDAGIVQGDADLASDAAVLDASEMDAAADGSKITGACAETFGNALTASFGRLDGVVYAVQKPSDTQCVMPNADHVVVQVLWNGAVYRMVVNVLSNGAEPKVSFGMFDHALPAPAFAEGWHTDAPLDYVTTLGVHSNDSAFTAYEMNALVSEIADLIKPGDPIAVYATSGAGRPESTHLVHRNDPNEDGALVIHPTTSPRFLLFHFSDQTF